MESLKCYHAHIYYDGSSFDLASKLCDEVGALFDVPVGFNGPHPMWSCQISLKAEKFAEVVPWLMLNRQGLTVFIHANTGDDLKDHTEHTMWMGSMQPLNLDIFL
ncbi:MAG: DOPA 4,5-dioxygenase family protein [Ghiorsea sp.]|nr:DOPA 4,5-dioxygenase family protein [Ghiorsea sp.]